MSGEMQKTTYVPRELSVVGAVGDAHRQLKDALGMSPFATFPDDATLVIRIRKGETEMDVHVDIEHPTPPKVEKMDMPIPTIPGVDESRVHVYEKEITIDPLVFVDNLPRAEKAASEYLSKNLEPGHSLTTPGEEEVYYDTLHHYPMIRPWLPKDDPKYAFVVTKVFHKGVVIWTITHPWNDKDWLPSRFRLEPHMLAPKIYWSGSEVIKRNEEIEDAFGHQGASNISY